MSSDSSYRCKAKVGDAGSSVLVDQNVSLQKQVSSVQKFVFERIRYPFKISVDDPEVMHILQAVRNVR